MSYNHAYQSGPNSPLVPKVRKRIEAAKNRLNLTLAQTGERFGFSGAFTGALLRDPDPARVRTKHVDRIIDVLEKLEVEAGIRAPGPAHNGKPASDRSADPSDISSIPLEELMREITRRGFAVRVSPLPDRPG